MERKQRVKIHTTDGEVYRADITIFGNYKVIGAEERIKKEMNMQPEIKTDTGMIDGNKVHLVEFVDDKDGKIGF